MCGRGAAATKRPKKKRRKRKSERVCEKTREKSSCAEQRSGRSLW